MDILSELDELKSNFQLATESKAALENGINDLKAVVASKDEELASTKASLESKESELAELAAAVAAKDDSLSAIQAKVEELTANQKTVEEKAIEIAASQGIAPFKVDSKSADTLSAGDARAEYARLKAIDPSKAGEYFAAHTKLFVG